MHTAVPKTWWAGKLEQWERFETSLPSGDGSVAQKHWINFCIWRDFWESGSEAAMCVQDIY